jgi:glycosyltransferase involved in cell wall biosynthesis
MNLAFCFWLARQRHRNVWVMFHEVAFPFKSRQPIKHHFLAAMHRLMAWIVLRNAKQSFTSIEAYQELLTRLSPDANVGLLRIFSNVPFDVSQELAHEASAKALRDHRVLGVFSSYGVEICELMEGVLPTVMENSSVQVKLVGPGSAFLERFCARFPHLKDRLSTTGRVSALDAGPHLQACDLLLQLYPDGAAGARGTFVAALASGVPVITTAGPFTEPLLKSSRAVAFSDPEPQAIRRVIDDMLADQNLIQELGAAGRRLYLDHFAVAVTVGKLQEAAQAGALLTSKQAAQLRSQAAR